MNLRKMLLDAYNKTSKITDKEYDGKNVRVYLYCYDSDNEFIKKLVLSNLSVSQVREQTPAYGAFSLQQRYLGKSTINVTTNIKDSDMYLLTREHTFLIRAFYKTVEIVLSDCRLDSFSMEFDSNDVEVKFIAKTLDQFNI